MKSVFYIILLFLIVSCKTKKIIPSTGDIDFGLKNKEIQQFHNDTRPSFETISGTLSLSFESGKNKQSFPISFRIKKGETIWLSAPLGIAKGILTPKRVQFYNKMDNTYFDGDYSVASYFFWANLYYESIENLLLGQIFWDEKYTATPTQEGYLCKMQQDSTEAEFLLNSSFRLKEASMYEDDINWNFAIKYTYQMIENQIFPNNIHIKTKYEENQTFITIGFNTIELNKSINFPYKVPSGYKPLIIN